jgi:hypothetical protein
MDELIARIVSNVGIDAGLASKAIGMRLGRRKARPRRSASSSDRCPVRRRRFRRPRPAAAAVGCSAG